MRTAVSVPGLAMVAVAALGVCRCADAAPPAIEIVTVVAVDAHGQPTDGYHEKTSGGTVSVYGCTGPSPAAVSDNIYACASPDAAAAYVCWPSTPDTLALSVRPVGQAASSGELHGSLPPVSPPATPVPFAANPDWEGPCPRPTRTRSAPPGSPATPANPTAHTGQSCIR